MADLVLIDSDLVRPAPGTRVLKKASYTIIDQAQAILNTAHKKADEIIASAQAEFQEERQRGYTEGLECARQEMAQELAATAMETQRHYDHLKEETVSLVMAVVKKVLKNIEPQALIVAQVNKALETFKGGQRITLKIHPTQAERIASRLEDISSSCPGIEMIDIQVATDIPPGQVMLVSATGILEASLDSQLTAIETAFRQTLQLAN